MKKQHVYSIVMLGLLSLAGSAFAQTINVRSDVPFSFSVAGKSMPAGHYTIQSATADGKTLALVGDHSRALVNANGAEQLAPASATKLVFHVYGGEYFLAEVWTRGNTAGQQIAPCNRERELAKAKTANAVEVLAQAR